VVLLATSEVFDKPIYVFWGCLFFVEGLLFKPLCVFWGCLFFVRGLSFEAMNKKSDSAPLFMAPCDYMKMLIKFELTLSAVSTLVSHKIVGERSFIDASGYISSASLKTSHP
jgi:hypothetical protein